MLATRIEAGLYSVYHDDRNYEISRETWEDGTYWYIRTYDEGDLKGRASTLKEAKSMILESFCWC